MTLSDWSEIAGIASGVGVAVSVIYLALQVRQAEKSQRAMMQQGRATRASEAAFRLAEPGFSALYSKGARAPKELTLEQIDRYMLTCRAAFLSAEDLCCTIARDCWRKRRMSRSRPACVRWWDARPVCARRGG